MLNTTHKHHVNQVKQPYFFKNIINLLSKCPKMIQKTRLVNLFLVSKKFRIKRNMEAICRTLAVLFRHMDARDFSIIKRDYKRGGQFFPMSLKEIAQEACISIRSVKKAMSDLIKADYIKSTRQYEEYQKIDKSTGEIITKFKAKPSIKVITVELLNQLGITFEQIKKLKTWKNKVLSELKAAKEKIAVEVNHGKKLILTRVKSLREKIFFRSARQHTEKINSDIPRSIQDIILKSYGF